MRSSPKIAAVSPSGPDPADALVRYLSSDGGISVRTVSARGLAAEAAARHETTPLATVALGRTLLGAVLLGSSGKDGETVQIRFRGSGPLGHVVAIADCEGRARGYVSHPDAHVPARGTRMDVAGGIGLGDLSVVRHRPGWRKPYTGIVPITAGEVAQDLTLYLSESEQTPSALALGVTLDETGAVTHAGGYLAQALPGADDDAVAQLEANVQTLAAPTDWMAAGGDPEGLAQALLDGIGGERVGAGPAHYHCGCDADRVTRAVALLGREDLEQAISTGETLEVRCEFCAERYRVDPGRARALLLDA